MNVELATAIASENPPIVTKKIIIGTAVIAMTTATGDCLAKVWNPIGIAAYTIRSVYGIAVSIVSPIIIVPDQRYVKRSPDEYRGRAIRLISLIPESKINKTNKFDVINHLNSYSAAQFIYPTRRKLVGGDRCSDGLVNGNVAN